MEYNIWNKWDPIEVVMLGDHYKPEFFDLKDKPKAMDALKRISEETLEELSYFETVLKDFGAQVLRPKVYEHERISNYISGGGHIPRSSLQPRDSQLVIGNQLYYTGHDYPTIRETLDQYSKSDHVFTTANFRSELLDSELVGSIDEELYVLQAGADWPSYEDYIAGNLDNVLPEIRNEIWKYEVVRGVPATNVTVVGSDLYVDDPLLNIIVEAGIDKKRIDDYDDATIQYFYQHLEEKYRNFRINRVKVGGHNDATFHTIKPGAILSLNEIQTYENTFPGWDVCYLPNQSWKKVHKFLEAKRKNRGKWWVPGEEANDEFTNFVEDWLGNWVGYVEETVFDVNVFVLDEHHVCVNNLNPQVVEFLKKHKMEAIHIPWRHRYFWDGGLHCITLDLKRRGVQKDYFPERKSPVIDGGF